MFAITTKAPTKRSTVRITYCCQLFLLLPSLSSFATRLSIKTSSAAVVIGDARNTGARVRFVFKTDHQKLYGLTDDYWLTQRRALFRQTENFCCCVFFFLLLPILLLLLLVTTENESSGPLIKLWLW